MRPASGRTWPAPGNWWPAVFPAGSQVLFSPQHGLLGEKQDNMIASADFADPVLHLPVVSLYGPRLTPPPEALAAVDVILVDLVDVGTRVYTFAATLAKVMEAAAPLGKKVVVLDRPNPIGGDRGGGQPAAARSGPPLWGLTPCPCATASAWGSWPATTTSPRLSAAT